MYIKLHKLSWIRNYQNPQKFNEQTYPTVQIVTDNTIKHKHMPYNLPTFLSVDYGYTFLYALIRIRY